MTDDAVSFFLWGCIAGLVIAWIFDATKRASAFRRYRSVVEDLQRVYEERIALIQAECESRIARGAAEQRAAFLEALELIHYGATDEALEMFREGKLDFPKKEAKAP